MRISVPAGHIFFKQGSGSASPSPSLPPTLARTSLKKLLSFVWIQFLNITDKSRERFPVHLVNNYSTTSFGRRIQRLTVDSFVFFNTFHCD